MRFERLGGVSDPSPGTPASGLARLRSGVFVYAGGMLGSNVTPNE